MSSTIYTSIYTHNSLSMPQHKATTSLRTGGFQSIGFLAMTASDEPRNSKYSIDGSNLYSEKQPPTIAFDYHTITGVVTLKVFEKLFLTSNEMLLDKHKMILVHQYHTPTSASTPSHRHKQLSSESASQLCKDADIAWAENAASPQFLPSGTDSMRSRSRIDILFGSACICVIRVNDVHMI